MISVTGKSMRGTLAGAVSYPYDQLERGTARLPKNRKLILYCDHGGGSMQMARMLGEQGVSCGKCGWWL